MKTRSPETCRVQSPEDDRGFVIVGVVMFVLALTILGLSLFSLSSYESQFLNRSLAREQACGLQHPFGGVDRGHGGAGRCHGEAGMPRTAAKVEDAIGLRGRKRLDEPRQVRPGRMDRARR
jgi:hypothetical protein